MTRGDFDLTLIEIKKPATNELKLICLITTERAMPVAANAQFIKSIQTTRMLSIAKALPQD